MINDETKSEIRVLRLLITGHYEFEIVLRNVNKVSEKTIFRRYSDIEWLHEGLLKYYPGCRIPHLPNKNIWTNLNVNNSNILEKRSAHIEDYLKYINSHKYLKESEVFKIFCSDDFEYNKVDHEKKSTLYEKFSNMTQFIPSILKGQKMKGLSTIEDNQKLDKDRENLVRLLKATKDLNINMKDYVKINEEKTEAIKNIIIATKKLQYASLDYNYREEDAENENKYDKSVTKNLDVINNFYEHNKIFSSKKYEAELKEVIEIFERKEKEENKLNDLLNKDRDEEVERDIEVQKLLLQNLNKQLLDEISNFKINRETDLLKIINTFIKNKADCNNDTSLIFESSK